MENSKASFPERLEHAHLVADRDKKLMMVMAYDGVTLKATREQPGDAVEITTYDLYGTPVGSAFLPYEAFMEITDMLLQFH